MKAATSRFSRSRLPGSGRPGRSAQPLLLAAVCAVAGGGQAAAAEGPFVYKGAAASPKFEARAVNVDVRELPPAPQWRPGMPIKEIPRRNNHQDTAPPEGAGRPVGQGPDPLLAVQAAQEPTADRAFTPPQLSFAGQGFSGVNPPDTIGDVGKDYYVQMINGSGGARVAIYNKADGSPAAAPFLLESLAAFGVCRSGLGDPVVLYDELAGRWFLSEFSSVGNTLCVYVSQTGDPVSGGWYAYAFQSMLSFPDYPKYAVWPDAYYVSTNESRPGVYALERAAMLHGDPASFQFFADAPVLRGFGFQALLPADHDGEQAPPSDSPAWFMRHVDDEVHFPFSADPDSDFLEIWEFDVDFADPASSTFTGPLRVTIEEIDSDLCGLTSFSCFPQPGSATRLDPLREVVMWRLQYRNFGAHESLVGNLVTDVDGTDHGGVRWFELRKGGGADWGLHNEGTYAPDSDNRWMGSVAMDADGNMALGYSVSSSATFPSMRYTGRLASDPGGVMSQPETTIVAGTGANASNRWGDYSAMTVDPADGCTFWHTNMYSTASRTWSTQIATFAFDGCGGATGKPGDFNDDDCVDRADLVRLLIAIRSGSSDPDFDLTGDGVLDRDDVIALVQLFDNPRGEPCA